MNHETKPDDPRAGQPVAPATRLLRMPAWVCEEHLGRMRSGCSECEIESLIARIDQERARAEKAEAENRKLREIIQRFTHAEG